MDIITGTVGWIEVICGPMFSGKSEELIRRLRRAIIARKRVEVFKPIIDKIHAEVVKILTDPAVREKSERTGNYPVTSTPDQFSAFIRKEADRWGKVMKETAIKVD